MAAERLAVYYYRPVYLGRLGPRTYRSWNVSATRRPDTYLSCLAELFSTAASATDSCAKSFRPPLRWIYARSGSLLPFQPAYSRQRDFFGRAPITYSRPARIWSRRRFYRRPLEATVQMEFRCSETFPLVNRLGPSTGESPCYSVGITNPPSVQLAIDTNTAQRLKGFISEIS